MIEPIAKLPRVSLGCFRTPLIDASRLSAVLAGPRILIKRDDLTGLGLGGHKCRRMEFLLGQGHDSYVISEVSNQSLALASACAKLGIKLRQVLPPEVIPKAKTGNYLLHRILGSDMRIVETGSRAATLDEVIAKRKAVLEIEVPKLQEEGYNPYVFRPFDPPPIANVGWVDAADEIWQQLEAMNIEAQYLIVANGQGGTQAGLEVGTKYLGTPFKVVGVSCLNKRPKAISEVVRMSNELAEFLALGMRFTPEDITVYDEYIGEGYGKITKECIEAIRLVAQTEGFFLDPVYTGKAMAGLIDLIQKGRFTGRDTLVFVHTGGIAELFAYYEELAT